MPVGVSLDDVLDGPDLILLQQLASRWSDLRSEFGDALLTRLSGSRESESRSAVWNALALVARQDATLQLELENAVADDPELLRLNCVLVWYVARASASADTVIDALVAHLQDTQNDPYYRRSPVSILLAECDRFGFQREKLQVRLEEALEGLSPNFGDNPVLEALAVLCPEHPVVSNAWQELSALIADRRDSGGYPVHPSTYFAVAYAGADSPEILNQIGRNADRLNEIGNRYWDNAFARHVSYRLRRDPIAAKIVRDAVMNPETPDPRAALLVSFLADAVSVDEELLKEVERLIADQSHVTLAPFVRDHVVSATLSVRTIFTRVADATWEVGSA